MDGRHAAPTLGVLSSSVIIVVLVVPYLVVNDISAVGTYYSAGVVTPWAAGLLALVAVIVFAAGREERTDPVTAAGIGLGLGVVMVMVASLWAISVPSDVPLQLTTDDPIVGPLSTAVVLEYHRWLLMGAAVGPVAAAGWYARTLTLL